MTGSATVRQTSSRRRSLPSIAMLNSHVAQTPGKFEPRSNGPELPWQERTFLAHESPLFHGGHVSLVAGSWILDMLMSPSSPPTPSIGTAPTRGRYRSRPNDRFRVRRFNRHRCGAVARSKPIFAESQYAAKDYLELFIA